MDPAMEIRKLQPSHIYELSRTLETNELWKCLMCIIPEKLERFNYVCNVSLTNLNKYHSEHFRLIENHCKKTGRSCTEILFDEWGTSGRVRPTLGHLLHLLTKAELFGAADYIAETLLHQSKPKRPATGPAALVHVNVPATPLDKNAHIADIEKALDKINYPRKAVNQIIISQEVKKPNKTPPKSIPKIVYSPVPDEGMAGPKFAERIVKERKMSNDNSPANMRRFSQESVKSENVQSASDMIQFSEEIKTDDIPLGVNESIPDVNVSIKTEDIPAVVVDVGADTSRSSNLPAFDMIGESHNLTSENSNSESSFTSENCTSSSFAPNFNELLESTNEHKSSNIPNLSILGKSLEIVSEGESSGDLPDFGVLKQSETQDLSPNSVLPDFTAIQNSSNSGSKSVTLNISDRSSSENLSRSQPCTSPLPVLSLNTLLPHYTYLDLLVSTDNFNERPYTSHSETGRLLGSGAFGSVFIAFGLLDKPVAVKKLVLEDLVKNVESVDEDDTITKQFRNEVELLSKYEHENLLSLLGYSCDGCTYCLVYEYIKGGALKDSLQVTENKLQWKDRLKIARGTASAVSYLHTAFETPLIHRDITSANILLDDKNSPKLCDFGLIKLSPKHTSYSMTTIFGTSAYMAPEAFSGDISVKMDTFSFGVVLLELLTSLPPMDDKREERDLWTHIKENCEDENILPFVDYQAGSWEEGRVNFATELFGIALKCLEKKKKRPFMLDVTVLFDELTAKMSG